MRDFVWVSNYTRRKHLKECVSGLNCANLDCNGIASTSCQVTVHVEGNPIREVVFCDNCSQRTGNHIMRVAKSSLT